MSFEPSKTQEEFRLHARSQADDGRLMVSDWCRSFDGMTVSTWDEWVAADGFMDWWHSLFPEHAGVTVADLAMLDFQGHAALMRKLHERDTRAIQVWGTLKKARDEAERINGGAGSREALEALLAPDPSNNAELMTGWYLGPTGQAR